jgi:putative heme iron utilization protein
MSHGVEARRHLASLHAGVLSTASVRYGGHPFGSLARYVLDHAARPVILVSRLAEHTRNIEADPRVSLIAHHPAEDVQAGARVTLLGNTARVEDDQVSARYCRYFPDAEGLLALGDFFFVAIAPVAVRLIAGFGAIHWIAAGEYAPPANSLAAAEAEILAHMNADHAHNLLDYCRHVLGKRVSKAEMVGIDPDGFDVRADAELLRFSFDAPVTDAVEARAALVALAKASRGPHI